MIHLIAFAKFNNDKYMYDYHVNECESKKIIEKSYELSNNTSDYVKSMYTTHILTTNDHTNVEDIDSYFKGSKKYDDMDEFIKVITEKSNLTACDVASYIKQNFPCGSFALQKVI